MASAPYAVFVYGPGLGWALARTFYSLFRAYQMLPDKLPPGVSTCYALYRLPEAGAVAFVQGIGNVKRKTRCLQWEDLPQAKALAKLARKGWAYMPAKD